MLLSGDEFSRTQGGNNNAYCQDNETSWVDWSLLGPNEPLLEFTRRLIRFRKLHPSLRRRTFFEDEAKPAVAWHGTRPGKPDWSPESRTLGMQLLAAGGDEAIYLAVNAHWEPRVFELPRAGAGRSWRRFVDTSLSPGEAALEPGHELLLDGRTYPLGPRSVAVFVAR
jgi:glycogen operon protein